MGHKKNILKNVKIKIMKKQYLVIGALALSIVACKKNKAENTEAIEEASCSIVGTKVACKVKEEFKLASKHVLNLKTSKPKEMSYKQVKAYNDSILKLIAPLKGAMEKVYAIDKNHANLYVGGIAKIEKEMALWTKKIAVMDNLVLKGVISNPKSRGEKFMIYIIENNSDEAFEMITMTTTFLDKDGNVVYTDDGDAIGNDGFLPAMANGNFPAGYKGKDKKAYILGPDESLHSKIYSVKQEVTNISF